MTYQLPNPLRLEPGESLASLVVRNAAQYRFHDPVRILQRLRPPTNNLGTLVTTPLKPELAAAMRNLLVLTPAQFDLIAYGTEDSTVLKVLGHRLHEDFVQVRQRRYCPLCLREAPYHRALWDISVVTACPVHGVMLTNRCPAGHALGWVFTEAVHHCHHRSCRADLTAVEAVPVPAEQMRGVLRLVEQMSAPPLEDGPFSLAFGDQLKLAYYLGLLAQHPLRLQRPHYFGALHPDRVSQVLTDGWAVLDRWPDGFDTFLDAQRAHAQTRQGRFGITKEFGTLLPRFIRSSADEVYGPLLADVFADHVAQRPYLTTRVTDILERRTGISPEPEFVTLNEAAAILRTSRHRTRTIAHRFNLFAIPPTGTGAPVQIYADKLKAVANGVGMLSKARAASFLNLARKQFMAAEAAGVLPLIPAEERLFVRREYRQADLEALLASLEARVRPEARPSGRLINVKRLAQQGLQIHQLLQAVLDGSLVPVGIDENARGVERLLFPKISMARMFGGPERGLSIIEVSRELRVHEAVATLWVDRGFIRAEKGSGRLAKGRRISREALDAFHAGYVVGGHKDGAGGTVRLRQLVFHGVQPVSGPMVDGCRRCLFRRHDIEVAKREGKVGAPLDETQAEMKRRATALAGEIGQAAAVELGIAAVKRWNSYVDETTETIIQVTVARRSSKTGQFFFPTCSANWSQLDRYRNAWVALGFIGEAIYVLVPWEQVRAELDRQMAGRDRVQIRYLAVRVDGSGRAEPFADFVRSL
ncbi:MAG: hypothetical protein FD119_133 [Stygiobacter sp.]|nr:MAG: hypothetical protein FD119_133 [Stygiobacter sp.]